MKAQNCHSLKLGAHATGAKGAKWGLPMGCCLSSVRAVGSMADGGLGGENALSNSSYRYP